MGEESDVRDGTHDSPRYFENGYPLVTSKNLKSYGLDLSDVSFISSEDFELINNRSKVDIGDVLFGMIGTIGNPVLVDRNDFAIKNVALIKENQSTSNRFLVQLLKSPIFERYITNENAGGTQKFLALSKIRSFEFLCPCKNEQKQISNFFKQLDETITLQERELELLKEQKKGFLQKLFPKDMKSSPDIRFEHFEDVWEQRKLGELYKIYSGMTPYRGDSSNYDNPEVPWIKTTDLKNKTIDTNEEDISNKAANKLKLHPNNTVLVAMYGGFNQIGRTGLLTYPATINQALAALEPNEKIIPYFLIMQLNFRINEWKRVAASSRKDPNITKKDVENFALNYPKFEEQTQIGKFFKQLDETITLQEKKLENMKQIKKAFLQKMFM